MKKVSIIVAIYNVEKYLKTCLDSIVNQTYKNIEIILVNDGSKDNCSSICEEYSKLDSRIKYINQQNQGVSIARNNGIKASTGEYIMFVDGDDWLEKNIVEKMINVSNNEKFDVICCGYYANRINEETPKSFFEANQVFTANEKDTLLKKCISIFGVPWAKMFNLEFIKKNEITFVPGLKRMQDSIFNLHAFNKIEKVYYLNEPLYHYRILNTSVTNKKSEHADEVANQVIFYTKDFIDSNNCDFLYELFYYRCFELFVDIVKLKIISDEVLNNKQKIKEIKNIFNFPYYKEAIKKCKYKYTTLYGKIRLFLLKRKMYSLFYHFVKLSYNVKRINNYK